MPRSRNARLAVLALLSAASASAASARPGPWDRGKELGSQSYESDWRSRGRTSGEGRIDVARFIAEGDAAEALRHGTIAVVAMPGGAGGADLRQDATFQAAVESELLASGYQAATSAASGQIAEVRIKRSELVPAEAKRHPVSGERSVGLSNRGSMIGLGLNIDATKPLKALIGTTLEARILDRATNAVLWEGRAAIATRDGDDKWTDAAIATRLAHALFDGFPTAAGEVSVKR
ncbi:hypothetical protein B0I00_2264 [Novosphingobium kunmingense]|uniref:DUF4136 domain-containing protein n=1 Tax=Novosphingobium kunmingense TaxID=1211806 RepID=A0A2N0H6W3_9SPHN|nr:DUF4136 domain-containing protein [Novosphingobium kunmingense]PKB14666.1 hypothetical protein B0I00_2264 [Novosphingobium kunmingense]